MRTLLRANRRPVVLATIAIVFLVCHHVLLRKLAHDNGVNALLAAGNATELGWTACLAIALAIVRLVTFLVVPGLLLAAAAELVAYLLVGPKRVDSPETRYGDLES